MTGRIASLGFASTCIAIATLFPLEIKAAEGPQDPEVTLAALEPAEGLEVKLFASEPMITNPTNIAVDERGRVWVCDVVNYRRNNGKRPEGDRILILEDTDGDGAADKSTVFYQGRDIDSALGICVLGDRVIVSCSPNIFEFFDDDGDDVADRKELLYTKTGISQHDHVAHAFVFGPDGMLYWNIGNEHSGVFDAEGEPIVDVFGRDVLADGEPYRQGMAFRCDQDGHGDFEVLAYNLRNSYELAVDSFGGVWFSDNDDDGNRGTRICYTLEGGNYGYLDEMTGDRWQSRRTGMAEEIPLRHWHLNDPGVVPNMLQTGSGSPSGILIYEGELLPERFQGNLIHCEPGHNVVRCYAPQEDGAGYSAEILPLLDGRRDQYFRPADVVVAPDGSLLVADWYDPGVGGHHQGDIERGRIYRVAPPETPYKIPELNVADAAGAIAALTNPSIPLQYAGYTALAAMGQQANDALLQLAQSKKPQDRARAYWLLAQQPGGGRFAVQALQDSDERVRMAGVRMARISNPQVQRAIILRATEDESPRVRREAVIALRHYNVDDFAQRWTKLAQQYTGDGRWMLEAIGIAADGRWDECLEAYEDQLGASAWQSQAGRKLIWRSRGSDSFGRIAELLADPDTPREEIVPLLRSLDFAPAPDAAEADALLTQLAARASKLPEARRNLILSESLKRLRTPELTHEQVRLAAELLAEMPRDEAFVEFVQQFRLRDHYTELLALAMMPDSESRGGAELLQYLLREGFTAPMQAMISAGDGQSAQLIRMLSTVSDAKAVDLLLPIIRDQAADIDLRREAVRAVAANREGANELLNLVELQQLDEPIAVAFYYALKTTPWQQIRERAAELVPEQPASESDRLPVAEWVKLRGDAGRGRELFATKGECANCHRAGDVGKDIGPSLSEIGSKLSRTGLYEALLFPNAAISHSYETYLALTEQGTAIQGVLVGQTDDTVSLKTEKDVVHELQRDQLEALEKLDVSLMPDGIHKLLDPNQLADVVEYLTTLRESPKDSP